MKNIKAKIKLTQLDKYSIAVFFSIIVVTIIISITFCSKAPANTGVEGILRQKIDDLEYYNFSKDEQNSILQDTIAKKELEIPKDTLSQVALPYCLSYLSPAEYQDNFAKDSRVGQLTIKNFFANKEFNELLNKGKLYQLCYSRDLVSFVLFGDYGKNNNVVGVYDPGSFNSDLKKYENEKLITAKIYNRNTGDIGLCTIDGFIERNVIFSCGGGDGPFSYNTVYILDAKSGSAKKIKDCYFDSESMTETKCQINTLDLEE